MQTYLARDALEERRVYRLHSRNLAFGAWRPEKNDFIGIRMKFGHRFLDAEIYEHTAFPLEALYCVVPNEIPLVEHLDSIDEVTGRPVDFDRPIRDGGRGWYFLDGEGEASEKIQAVAPMNRELFEYLDDVIESERRESDGSEIS